MSFKTKKSINIAFYLFYFLFAADSFAHNSDKAAASVEEIRRRERMWSEEKLNVHMQSIISHAVSVSLVPPSRLRML